MPRASEPRQLRGIENRRHERRGGLVYWTFRVRWKDPATGQRVSEEFDSQQDAQDFKAALRLARRAGTLGDLNAGRETLAELVTAWWEDYASHNLARKTLRTYSGIWNLHALPRVGHLEVRAVTPGVVSRLRSDLEKAGVGDPTIRKGMSMLQAVFRWAVETDRLKVNPVSQVRKPAAARSRAVQPLVPDAIESVREYFIAAGDMLSAVLISVLAYAGLRPEEALALEWRHVRKETLLIEQKNVDGEIAAGQKVLGAPPRTIDLLAALRGDLAERQLLVGRPHGKVLVFPRPDGEAWRETDYRNWRRRHFRPAAAAAGLASPGPWDAEHRYDGPRPYDLRHSFASLLIHEGSLSVAEIAAQMGHSTETLLSTYTHVFSELRGQKKVSADVQIARARDRRLRRFGS